MSDYLHESNTTMNNKTHLHGPHGWVEFNYKISDKQKAAFEAKKNEIDGLAEFENGIKVFPQIEERFDKTSISYWEHPLKDGDVAKQIREIVENAR